MKLEFYWEGSSELLLPACKSDIVNKDDISIISCLLMDDGGLPYLDTIEWFQTGIGQVQSVLTGELPSSDWSREAWGAYITLENCKIYSLYDEEYFEELSTNDLDSILKAWSGFLLSKPQLEKVVFWQSGS